MNELIETERKYVKDLQFVIRNYKQPLVKLGILSSQEANDVFLNVEGILEVSQRLLELLEPQTSLPLRERAIGSIFSDLIHGFNTYVVYCSKQHSSQSVINSLLEERKDLKKFIAEVKELPESRQQDISSFLIKPLQRICRYPLLFKELLRELPEDHPDVPNIRDVIASMQEIISQSNELKRVTDNVNAVVSISESIRYIPEYYPIRLKLTTGSVQFVAEETFKEYTAADGVIHMSKPFQTVRAFLFSELLLVCRKQAPPRGGALPLPRKKKSDEPTHAIKHALPLESVVVFLDGSVVANPLVVVESVLVP